MKKLVSKDIRKIIIALVVVVAIAGVSLSALALDGNPVVADISQGSITAKEISINTKIPGRIVQFYVEEGQVVKAGDPLVQISSDEIEAKKLQLEAQIAQATAGVRASEAVVEMAKANYQLALERVEQAKAGAQASRHQRDMASAVNEKAKNGARTQQVAQAESAFLLWDATLERAKVLYEGGALSQQKFEEITTQRNVAEQTFLMAKEGARTEDKAAAYSQLSMAEAGIAASDAVVSQALEGANIALSQIAQAQAGLTASQGLLAQAEAGLLEVNAYLKDTMITAPMDGTVTTLNSDEGELVSTGSSIGTVANLDNCWVTVNLDEDKLAGLEEGQKVSVKLLAYEGKIFEGTVATINKQPDFAIKKATSENGNFDIVSFGVKIIIDNADEVVHPGMTAVVDFDS